MKEVISLSSLNMQNIKQKNRFVAVDNWLTEHAVALIAYAEKDSLFAESLAHHIQKKKWQITELISYPTPSRHLIPQTKHDAIQETHWLLQILDDNQTAKTTKDILNNWARHYESPKDFVIGIVGVAVIGPTLGIISKKKKRKSILNIVIEDNWYKKQSSLSLAEHVQTASMQVIAKELKLAGGNIYRLHPNTAEWFLEEPLTKIYLTNQEELKAVKTTCLSEKLSHYNLKEETGLEIMTAISPTVKEDFISEFSVEGAK